MSKFINIDKSVPGVVDFDYQLLPGDHVVLRDHDGRLLLSFDSSVCAYVCINFLPSPDGLV